VCGGGAVAAIFLHYVIMRTSYIYIYVMCVCTIIYIYVYKYGVYNMQQEARYTPVDAGQRRRKSSSGVPEHNARSNCFYIPNFNIKLSTYIVINYYCLLFCADAISRHTILQQQFAARAETT